MEFQHIFLKTLVEFLFVIIIPFLVLIVNRKRANINKIIRKPPQAEGAWPVIGHLHLLGGCQPPDKVLGDMADKYGPIFTIKLGLHDSLVVSNREIVKECFTINDKIFSSRPKSTAVELMGYNYATFGLGPYGDYWRYMRKIFVEQVLSQQKVEMFEHVRVSELNTSMNYIYDAWVKSKESENSDMVKVEMKKWFENFMLNIVVRIISGRRLPPNDEEGIRTQNAVNKFFELIAAVEVSDFIPYMKAFNIGGYKKKMKTAGKEMDNILEGWLKEHKRAKESEQKTEENHVFIDALISILQGVSEEDFPGFDRHTILKASCLTFLVGALGTTSVTLTWALSLLLNNPKSLKIAQDEIDEQVGRERPVVEPDLKNLIYLEAIVKETLRLYSTGPLSVPRECMEDCIVSGYNIPKGTRLLVNLWKIHRDPNIWSNPHEFQPERFLTSQKNINVRGKHFELLPFGAGRRMCPGALFSLQTVRLTLASLIQQFALKRPSNEPVDMTKSSGANKGKATPLEVHLAPRLSLGSNGMTK